ncbi:protein phosphatase CheZ [Vibrio scophthalmi]|uniref:Protein phosphatase CheZ n=1 Tax=Vibrio scophthalmi TaxID=45658 RepID=A0A1B1NQV3_9VIBR|nr:MULTISPECIES: protein phosphatase CheZ [Vibrio]ANS86013.1 Protein phosphatase CheZ [Vibrio scophthalmi]ANU35855.1 Protein phosphatase CheZ [Vibrio scophthalmi]EGU36304.1 chemotaxis protein [Vibrio sp. N418]MCY9803023.1 protein phosphatase CheZ [Vibrio scophthalmi]ODS10785.1 Protein phosphatase CheZ [Vibrio scophthalmi]
MISLEQAKQLVELLESGQQQEADALVKNINDATSEPMLQEIGELTRELQESIRQFRLDDRIAELTNDEIPDARERLQYVIEKTEVAANKTMDAVDRCMPIADSLHDGLLKVRPQWNELMHGKIELTEFKALCHRIDELLGQVEGNSSELHSLLTDILMAQDFQDLTGQIIRRVIELVHEVELRLGDILTAFGDDKQESDATNNKKKASTDPEGPILNPHERADAVSSQDEVDDLLSSLGF